MKENANEKRLSLIENVLALSDEEVLEAILSLGELGAKTQGHETGHPNEPPPDPPPGGGQ